MVPTTGNWKFRSVYKDDRASMYFDDDRNNVFESSADNIHGTNPNAWNVVSNAPDGGTSRGFESGVFSLTAGQKHLFAAGMMEGGGGARMRAQIKLPEEDGLILIRAVLFRMDGGNLILMHLGVEKLYHSVYGIREILAISMLVPPIRLSLHTHPQKKV